MTKSEKLKVIQLNIKKIIHDPTGGCLKRTQQFTYRN